MNEKWRGYRNTDLMKDLVQDNPMILMAIGRFGIPFGFGDKSVLEVCGENSVDCDTFLAVCHLLSGYSVSAEKISLTSLISYLMGAHLSFLEDSLPKIRHNLLNAINYSSADEVSFLLIRFFDDYVEEVKRHMCYEDEVVFRYVENLLQGVMEEGELFEEYSSHHGHTVEKLNELKDIFIYHYRQKNNFRLSSVLLDIINCEKDMMSHFEVEKILFVPAVKSLERKVRLNKIAESASTESSLTQEETKEGEKALGEREKEIIRSIAKGKSNKEISEELCISVHTVATHRRNISSKLGIHSVAGLTIYAILHKLVDLNEIADYHS